MLFYSLFLGYRWQILVGRIVFSMFGGGLQGVIMQEIRQIVEALSASEHQRYALATVVAVEGSSYRRVGARMLVGESGQWVGGISGGCLEGDALRKARAAILSSAASVVVYDTTTDESARSLGVGLGCNGVLHVLIEPLGMPATVQMKDWLVQWSTNREGVAAMATVFSEDSSQGVMIAERVAIHPKGGVEIMMSNQNFAERLLRDLQVARQQGVSMVRVYEGVWVLLEVLRPSQELVIFGCGYDAIPLVNIAAELGWHITITDDCAAKVIPSRFIRANEVRLVACRDIRNALLLTDATAAVVMSHNFNYDLAVLRELHHTPVPYIGLLGPRKRARRLFSILADEGISLEPSRIYNPLGLDIGAESPPEIALAIVAEIKAVFMHRQGGSLREGGEFVHQRA